jgi:predicted nucleic acid-binding protein
VTKVIVDTGPLVALLNVRDRYHAWARDALDTVEPPVFTCEPVVSEACFLLATLSEGPDRVLELLSKDVIRIDFRLASEVNTLRGLMRKFADVPMSSPTPASSG